MKKKYKKLLGHISNTVHLLPVSIAVIMLWRGVWNFLDYYVFPDSFLLSNLLSIFLGGLILFLTDLNSKKLR